MLANLPRNIYMRSLLRVLFRFIVLMHVTPAFSNGGPVELNVQSPHGGISPLKKTNVRLIEEKLDIRIDDLARHYTVNAIYTLSNTEGVRSVKYGVPFILPDNEQGAKRKILDIEIAINNKKINCDVLEGTDAYSNNIVYRYKLKGPLYWCVADLAIPKGKNNVLHVIYRGSMQYSDSKTGNYPFVTYGHRSFQYLLFPASNWEGSAKKIDISIDLGKFVEVVSDVKPAGYKRQDTKLRWKLSNVDFHRTDEIRFQLKVNALLGFKERSGWYPDKNVFYSVDVQMLEASIEEKFKQAEFSLKNLLDRDSQTAWCADGQFGGVAEWFTLQIKQQYKHDACWFVGFVIVPGYTRNAETFSAYGRVSSLSISECDADMAMPGASKAYKLDLPRQYNMSAQVIHYDDIKPNACLRVTIDDIDEGKVHKGACLSTFVPLYSCDI